MHRWALPQQSPLTEKKTQTRESCTTAPLPVLLWHPSTSAFHSTALCLPSSQLVYFSPLSPLIPAVANVLQEFTTIFIVPEWDLNSLIPLKIVKLATLGLNWFRGPDMDGRGPLFWASPGGIKVTIENLPLCVGRRAQSDSQRKNLK